MTTARRWCLFLACGVVAIAGASAATTQENIGSWLIRCPPDARCQMRFAKRFLDKSGITGDLEIQSRGNTLVPVLVLRGLPNEALIAASLIGKTEVSLRLTGGAREILDCAISGAGFICAPNEAAGSRLASLLPSSREMTVRVAVAVSGMSPLPSQEKSLELVGTSEALVRLRAEGPTTMPTLNTALTSQSPTGLMAAADRALKAAGYPNGVSQLRSLIAKYMRK